MSRRDTVCYCHVRCPACEDGRTDAEAIRIHNERVACHGERTYPRAASRAPSKHWLRELYEG